MTMVCWESGLKEKFMSGDEVEDAQGSAGGAIRNGGVHGVSERGGRRRKRGATEHARSCAWRAVGAG